MGKEKLHSVRHTRGKKRGQFGKKIVVEARKNNAIATIERLAAKRQVRVVYF